jgi:hypothetical protein
VQSFLSIRLIHQKRGNDESKGLLMIPRKELEKSGITEGSVRYSQDKTPWEIANKIIYKICSDYPRHDNIEVAIAKIWIIGRTYAAAIERGAPNTGDQFYETKVGPQMVVGIDSVFEPLRTIKSVADKNLSMVMEAYNLTNELLRDIAGKERRSLSSKYLHFHFPNLYYLYDSRALESFII